MNRRYFVLLPAAALLAACATSGGGGPRRSARIITAEEIAGTSAITAADAIRQLRPQWLNMRGAPSTSSPTGEPAVIYVDRMREDSGTLQRLRASDIQRMEYLSPTDASNRFGTNHGGGAILVTTKGG